MHDATITLADGRVLGYAEYGDPGGHPVLYCHGFPGSRYEAALAHRAASAVNVRLLSLDRPGYGLSDPRPRRTILDWAADVELAADALGLARFAVVGISGGAPYALACAHAISQRVTATGIVCGMAPAHEAALRHAMIRSLRTGLFLAQHMPRLFRLVYAALVSPWPRWYPRTVAWLLDASPSSADRQSLRHTELKQTLIASIHEAFRQGSGAAVRDVELYATAWGFAVEAIASPVHLWHGEDDPTVPVSMGHYLAARLPQCRARFLPGEGHFSVPVNYATEILSTLVDSAS